MKSHRLRNGLLLFALITLTAGNINVLPAKAGASTIVVDQTSFQDKLDDSVWSNPDNNVAVENNTLVFPRESTVETRLITKSAARFSSVEDELVNVKATLTLHHLPDNGKFILALGLSSIEAFTGESGNLEVQFTKVDGVKASVVAYGEDGEQVVIAGKNVGSMNHNLAVEVSVLKEGSMTLKINGRVIGKESIPVSGEGRVGFLQTGECQAKIQDVRIVSYRYDNPENCDIEEDFESGSMNLNLLTSKMTAFPSVYLPCYAKIEEYNGNHVFMCNNSGETYIGTLYEYSNFELSFDIPYIQTLSDWNEQGEAIKPISGDLVIGWGYQTPKPESAADYMLSEQSITFRSETKVIPQGYADKTMIAETHPFFTAGCSRDVSVKVSVIDTNVTLFLKWTDESEWTEVMNYQMGTKTPLGYIQIWMLTPGNVAIDNLKIVNKDENPQLTDVDTKYEYLDKADDYVYQQEEDVYHDYTDEKKTFNQYLLIPVVAGICALSLGAYLGIITWKSKRKEVVMNERKKTS